ncbi:MAG TPA: hypothetical protein VFP35_00175 [Candidatus Saccharimonadales bacterium]|nr:hypothetical protein [Candidatus Saccharimonadales bacterium]
MDKNKEFILKGVEPTFLEVRPGDATVEDSVYSTFMNHMKDALSGMLVQESFSASDLPEDLAKEAEAFAPNVGEVILERESEYSRVYGAYAEVQPLHKSLAEVALHEQEVKFVVDPQFIAFFTGELRKIPVDNFAGLEQYHQILRQTAIVELLGQVERQINESDTRKDWVERAYRLVQLAVEHPQHYTPPLDHPESLMLLTYLNYKTRQLTRRVIVGNFLMAQTKANAGELKDDDERATLTALGVYFKADALSGQHWNDNAYRHHISEAVIKAASHQKAAKLHALADLQRLLKTPGGARIQQVYGQTTEHLREIIKTEDSAAPFKYWQKMDIGHTFDNFRALEMEFTTGRLTNTLETRPKDKGKAAILEDDEEQMELWRDVLDRHSGYVITKDRLTADPAEIIKMADDPEIRLFLLDIQNGQDTTAGIRAAKAIVEQKLRFYEGKIPEESQRTTVMIWSTSVDLVKTAQDEIDQYLSGLSEDSAKLISAKTELGDIQNSIGFGDTPIKVNIQLKGLDSWDLN